MNGQARDPTLPLEDPPFRQFSGQSSYGKTRFKPSPRRRFPPFAVVKQKVIQKAALAADFITVMLIVVFAIFTVCSIINLFATLVRAFKSPQHFVLGFDMHHDVLSSFFYVLIGEELLHSTLLHFDQNRHYAYGMIAVAITAVCRKIIILDYNTAAWYKLCVMACMVLGLGFGVWAIREKR